MKDMANYKRELEELKDNLSKLTFKTKQETLNEINDKFDQKHLQQENKDKTIYENIDSQINNFRKNMLNDIGHFKVETGQKINEIVESVNELQQKQGGSDELEKSVKELK